MKDFRATYKYNGTESNTINLEPGRVYCIIETTTSDWWLAANEKGQVGYVPGMVSIDLFLKVSESNLFGF